MGTTPSKNEIGDHKFFNQVNTDGKDQLRVSGPIEATKVIHIQLDKNNQFHGLPQYWRKILKIPLDKSHQQFKTHQLIKNNDATLLPQKANKKIMYCVNQLKENTLLISDPITTEHKMHVQIDPESATGFKGLPKELQKVLIESQITKTQVLQHPTQAFQALSLADLMESQQNFFRPSFPTNEQVKTQLKQKFAIKKYYKVLKKIGAGGYGSIFLCQSTESQVTYALKVVKPQDQEEITYIISEIAMMNVISHENIVALIDSYYFQQHYFMVLEFMDFGDLTKLIQSRWGNISQPVMAYIMRQSLKGLKQLHQKHRIHRDMKSDNILISLKGQIKLGDFGYIAQLTQQRQVRNTQVGTACWMAPEVIRKEDYDARSDIWSLGITLIEMTNKDPPYLGQKKARAFYSILVNDAPVPSPKEKWSKELLDFTKCCLKKDRNQRSTALELLKHPFLNKITDKTQSELQSILIFK